MMLKKTAPVECEGGKATDKAEYWRRRSTKASETWTEAEQTPGLSRDNSNEETYRTNTDDLGEAKKTVGDTVCYLPPLLLEKESEQHMAPNQVISLFSEDDIRPSYDDEHAVPSKQHSSIRLKEGVQQVSEDLASPSDLAYDENRSAEFPPKEVEPVSRDFSNNGVSNRRNIKCPPRTKADSSTNVPKLKFIERWKEGKDLRGRLVQRDGADEPMRQTYNYRDGIGSVDATNKGTNKQGVLRPKSARESSWRYPPSKACCKCSGCSQPGTPPLKPSIELIRTNPSFGLNAISRYREFRFFNKVFNPKFNISGDTFTDVAPLLSTMAKQKKYSNIHKVGISTGRSIARERSQSRHAKTSRRSSTSRVRRRNSSRGGRFHPNIGWMYGGSFLGSRAFDANCGYKLLTQALRDSKEDMPQLLEGDYFGAPTRKLWPVGGTKVIFASFIAPHRLITQGGGLGISVADDGVVASKQKRAQRAVIGRPTRPTVEITHPATDEYSRTQRKWRPVPIYFQSLEQAIDAVGPLFVPPAARLHPSVQPRIAEHSSYGDSTFVPHFYKNLPTDLPIVDASLAPPPICQYVPGPQEHLVIFWDKPLAYKVKVAGTFSRPPWNKRFELFWCPRRQAHWLDLSQVIAEEVKNFPSPADSNLGSQNPLLGAYQFKFVVDGNWMCDDDLAVCTDANGNVNNLILHCGPLRRKLTEKQRRMISFNLEPSPTHTGGFSYPREPLVSMKRCTSSGKLVSSNSMIDTGDSSIEVKNLRLQYARRRQLSMQMSNADDSNPDEVKPYWDLKPDSPSNDVGVEGGIEHEWNVTESSRASLNALRGRSRFSVYLKSEMSTNKGAGGDEIDDKSSTPSSLPSTEKCFVAGTGRQVDHSEISDSPAKHSSDEKRRSLNRCQSAHSGALQQALTDGHLRRVSSLCLDHWPSNVTQRLHNPDILLELTNIPDARLTTGLGVQCGAAMIPHPDKVDSGGADAFFVSKKCTAFGVADGVGEWDSFGLNPRTFAEELMEGVRKAADSIDDYKSRIAAQEERRAWFGRLRQLVEQKNGTHFPFVGGAKKCSIPSPPSGKSSTNEESPLAKVSHSSQYSENNDKKSDTNNSECSIDSSSPSEPTDSEEHKELIATGRLSMADLGSDFLQPPSVPPKPKNFKKRYLNNTEIANRALSFLREGYRNAKSFGSSTALVVCLDEPGENVGIANLGDSAVMVLRRHKVFTMTCVFKTKEQQHQFNCPYQLSRLPQPEQFEALERDGKETLVRVIKHNGIRPQDTPEMCVCSAVRIKEGDLIILGTDGLFDNLFDYEICQLANLALSPYEGILFHDQHVVTSARTVAQALAEAAAHRSRDPRARTPFMKQAKHAGTRYYGGKLDDITAVACWVVRQSQTGFCGTYSDSVQPTDSQIMDHSSDQTQLSPID